ncbi:MAG: hypothetical protein WD767_13240 [Alphaproteobacteria bacterium]
MNSAGDDREQVKRDPRTEFGTPEAVLNDASLSNGQKIEILRGWEYDAVEESVAQEEGMIGGDPPMIQRVQQALDTLLASDGETKTGPTKHGGIGDSPAKES